MMHPIQPIDVVTKARWALESGKVAGHKADLLRVALTLADLSLSDAIRAEAQAAWDALKSMEGDEPFSNDPDYEIATAARHFDPTEG
jgi:hypothetical protein